MEECIDYIDLIKRGFNRKEVDDEVHFNKYGWRDFILSLNLKKGLSLEWRNTTREVYLWRKVKKKPLLMKSMLIRDLNHLDDIIEFYKDE